jgi:hypothetical protein
MLRGVYEEQSSLVRRYRVFRLLADFMYIRHTIRMSLAASVLALIQLDRLPPLLKQTEECQSNLAFYLPIPVIAHYSTWPVFLQACTPHIIGMLILSSTMI